MALFWIPKKKRLQRKMNNLKENVDFRFVENTNLKATPIEILTGPFTGVVYHYGLVKMLNDTESPTMQFDYTLLESGNLDMDELQNNQEFVNMMGDLLCHIIENNYGHTNEPIRTNNSEEPDLQ